MVDERENLVLELLRDIRAKLDDHDQRFDEVNHRLVQLEQRTDELRDTMFTIAGFAMHANVRHETVTGRLATLEARVDRLEEKD
ncbi:hypothetical protein [Aurantimonas sp. VKM B-3413]|uniref:hypothetical protein n=1 Tax=Aurantimonas sp. VKM B-3413 TaxID=2779401 RepID=UPI001E5C7BD6|nr:hypothetical protein [Aurantimonas sp. VKM B-3413]MCB8838504.1 hypothetical protein [Aurantimonas sp. VKM B-3413]